MNLKKSKTAKLFAGAIGLSMALSFALPVGAQTTAELTAQINSLLAMIAQLQAQIAGGASTGGASVSFTSDLTVGSTGSQVSALQQWLVSKGYLVMPAGVAMGTFGPLTKTALAKYQAEAGISPAAGYFGPITRAKLNAMGGSTGGTGSTGGSTGITTPGVEGTLTVTSNNSGLASTVYEGDDMVSILGMNVEAKVSDIAVQRVKINLGTNNKIYTKGYSKLYITDGSNVLASTDLNSSTVVKEGSTYYVTVTGFNFIVPKNTKKQLVVKADVMSSIDSSDRTTLSSISVTLADNGVRGVDGAGIDQYSPTSGSTISRSVTFSAELAETATLKVSLNSASPKKQDVVASAGSQENEMDKLSLLAFDLRAEKDEVTLTDLTIDVTYAGSGLATATTLYLYDGSTELDSASVAATSATVAGATFSDIDYVIPKDTTKTLWVKADIRLADGTIRTIALDIDTADVTAENTAGDSITESGSATGYAIGVRNVGAEVTLVSKSITTTGVSQTGSSPLSTSTLTATFNVKVKAVGGDLLLGTAASGTPVFAKTGSSNSFKLYNGGIVSSVNNSTSTSYTIPNCVSSGTETCLLSENSEVTIPVTFSIPGRASDASGISSGLYSVGLEKVNWIGSYTSNSTTFMAGESDWRTADVSFP